MKKLFLMALAAATLVACGDNKAEEIEVLPYGYAYAQVNDAVTNGEVKKNMLFFGLSSVTTLSSGSLFTDDTALFEIEPADDGTLYLYMHATRFATGMPAVEMRIPQIAYTDKAEGSTPKIATKLDAAAAEYWVEATGKWQSNPNFKITDLTGTIDNLTYQVSFTCTRTVNETSISYSVAYSGRLLTKIN